MAAETTADSFPPAIEAQHRRIDADAHGSIYVVGDVHGCRETLARLVETLDPGGDDLVVLVGDLVRRGPDSPGVVEFVRSRPNVLAVRGNNEEKVIRGRRPPEGLSPADLRWLRGLPAVISWPGHAVVHAGVYPDRPLAAHSVTDVQNAEYVEVDGVEQPWWTRYRGSDRVFFGHRVLARALVRERAVGLDTGCVYGGALTAYDCERERTVRVEPERAHRERPPEKFLDPAADAESADGE